MKKTKGKTPRKVCSAHIQPSAHPPFHPPSIHHHHAGAAKKNQHKEIQRREKDPTKLNARTTGVSQCYTHPHTPPFTQPQPTPTIQVSNTSTHLHHPGIKRKAPTAKEGNDKATKDKVQALRVGEIVHVPHSVFPREKKPRGGYWVGKVCATKEGGAADVGIHIKDEPIFTRPALEVAQWRVQK